MQKKTLVYFLLTFPSLVQSQQVEKSNISFAKKELSGFMLSFDLPKKEVSKTYWSFSKAKGITEYIRDHYQTILLINDQKIKLHGRVIEEQGKSKLYMALDAESMSDSLYTIYNKKLPVYLKDFSIYLQKNALEKDLEEKEKSAARIGRTIEKLKKSGKKEAEQARLFIELNILGKEIDRLRTQLTLLLDP